MEDKDEICLCFHVTKRKLENFIRIQRPVRESQLSQCYGAGTGCGWCRPFLAAIFRSQTGGSESAEVRGDQLSTDDYAELRKKYIGDGKKRRSD